MSSPSEWAKRFRLDIRFGYEASAELEGPRHYNPKLVLNQDDSTVEHSLLEELDRCTSFTFSVAFVSPAAIAQLKQHFRDFKGTGRIITSDFLGFNRPEAFAELLNLRQHSNIDVRRHTAKGYHPKGYIFDHERSVTAMIGSSNLTSSALSQNHEWNLKVAAAADSDLAEQLRSLIGEQIEDSEPLTQAWIDSYAAKYVAPAPPAPHPPSTPGGQSSPPPDAIEPNAMQEDALLALDFARAEGAERAVIISATGTGKTILSALDVRAVNPQRFLFVVHREQILDRTIQEYRRVLGGSPSDYGKLTGSTKQADRRYVFATIQTLSQPDVLASIAPDAFDYVTIDEAHRTGGATYLRVIDYLTPAFLLGMTATPERTDRFNVFELFNYVVPYEIRLHQALEAELLAPFHYYGIADVTYDDGTTTTDETELKLLITAERVSHLIQALECYGQAGVPPRGLIFCSRKEEAHALSDALNTRTLRDTQIRTIALTGDDSVEFREECVRALEAGEFDYILTVDVFNEGVDIPTVNQVVMLRQTQSAIVFVQQLGRGLRLAKNKDYLVVIDFIGNYANNFLIPIALFGDESLNRESLRERLNETVDAGSLPGLSSVSFDEISRERILSSIVNTKLDSLANLKSALLSMQNRVGGVPHLWDFYRFEAVDPVVLATAKQHYPALVQALLKHDSELSTDANRALALISHEVLAAKRLHESLLLHALLAEGTMPESQIAELFAANDLPFDTRDVRTAIDTLALRGYSQTDAKRYVNPIVEHSAGIARLEPGFSEEVLNSAPLREAIADALKTGIELNRSRYLPSVPFTPGMQYSRRDAARIVGWPRSTASTIYGYKTDKRLGVATLFVTLHKAEDVDASTAYEDALLDRSSMRWFSRSGLHLHSNDVQPIVDGQVDVHVFVKKDDAEGSGHYYLGSATAHDAEETTMRSADGKPLSVVVMTLRFAKPIKQGLFDYFQPGDAGIVYGE